MGIFSRMRDIINSNINTMLEKAEDPEKLVKLMIQEMEDTLVEVKASCAGAMAQLKRLEREVSSARAYVEKWAENAKLALQKGRDDLAREALVEKRNADHRFEAVEREASETADMVEQYRADIRQLEEKLAVAREKHRLLIQRHTRATQRKTAQKRIRKMETSDAFVRFEEFQNRIERLEADADLVNYGRKPTLEEKFADLRGDDEIEQELSKLKSSISDSGAGSEQ